MWSIPSYYINVLPYKSNGSSNGFIVRRYETLRTSEHAE